MRSEEGKGEGGGGTDCRSLGHKNGVGGGGGDMALQSMGFDKQLLVHIYHAFLSFCFAFFFILILGNIVESPPS